jgi:lipoprotein-anchoring transpeptidase ErfK/SrfK
MFTKDAVRVTSGVSAASVGPQAIEETFKTQFKGGFRHIDLVIDQVSPFGTDAAITVGAYQITGQGQGGPLKVDGRWTEVEVREGGVWKIRLSTVASKIEPNAVTPRVEANSVIPRVEANSVTPRVEANSVTPRIEANSVAPRIEANLDTLRAEANSDTPRTEANSDNPRIETNSTRAGPETKSADVTADAGRSVPGFKKVALLVNIDKSEQIMTVSLDGVETYEWPVSTGKAGYTTPSGTYTAASMNEIWYSKQWDNAPMPHSIFFMKDGHAIHGSLDVKNLGKPASHGCVRISPENAATLYALVDKNGLANTRVVLTGVTPGGEYKVARRTIAGQKGFGWYQPGDNYYAQPRYSSQQYYAQPQARPGSFGQPSGARYGPQGYYYGMRSPYSQW